MGCANVKKTQITPAVHHKNITQLKDPSRLPSNFKGVPQRIVNFTVNVDHEKIDSEGNEI